MNIKTAAPLLAALAFAGAQPASAQGISGKYAIILQTACQAIVSGAAILKPGSVSSSVGLADFTPDAKNHYKGIVDIDETVVGGPPIAANAGSIRENPLHSTVAYSNTATTLTINGTRYNAIYTKVQNGTAERVFFNGTAAEGKFPNTCAVSGTLRAVTS
jgi:hypothetical protein